MQLLFLQQWLPDEILKALSWTFVHSLWEGLGAAIIAAIVILFTRRSSARLRYNLLGMVVILFLLATVVTFSQQLKNGTVAEKLVTPFTTDNAGISEVTFDSTAEPVSTTNVTKELVSFLNANADLFVLIWGIFFLVNCMKLITGMAGVHRIRQYKTHPVSKDWQTKLNQLSKSLGIYQSVRLLQSELVKVPVAIGHFKPVILVPLGLLSHLPPDQVETILLHELAHVRRKDYVINILQRFTESVFFFNPALLWISSLIRQEREACCDDIVVANTNHKGNYLEALISFHEYAQPSAGYAMAISTKRHYLLNRVRRMVTRENKKLNLMEKIFLLIGVATVTAFTFIPNKESEVKKNQAVVEPVKSSVMPVLPVSDNVLSAQTTTYKPVGKKVTKEPVLEITVDNPKIDTIPDSKNKEKDKSDSKVKGFSNMSSNVNDENGVRTEITTIIDNDGKTYSYTKRNDKITSFIVDGRPIPENEMGNYSDFFARIDAIREEKRIAKEEKMKRKIEEARIRNEEQKIRQAEQKLRLDDQKARDQERKIREKEKNREKDIDEIEKKIREKEKNKDKEMKEIENKQEKFKNEYEKKQKENHKKFEDDMKRLKAERDKENDKIKKEMEKDREKLRKDRERINQEKARINREKQETIRKAQIDRRGGRITVPRTLNGREVIINDENKINNTKETSHTIKINENDKTNSSNDGASAKFGVKVENGSPALESNKVKIFANALKPKVAVDSRGSLFDGSKKIELFKHDKDNFGIKGRGWNMNDKKEWEYKPNMPRPPKSQTKPVAPPVKKQKNPEVVFKASLRTEIIA